MVPADNLGNVFIERIRTQYEAADGDGFASASMDNVPGQIGVTALTAGPYLVSAAHNGDVDLEGNKLSIIAERHLESIKAAAREVVLPDGAVVTIPVTLLVTGYVLNDSGDITHAGGDTADCGIAQSFCVVAPYELSLPKEAPLSPGLIIGGGNSLGTPAITATLYATSQLYPSLSRDQVVARFIECLTYPEGVGTEQADGSLMLTSEERSLWGLGIPDLACIATPLGETMMQASAGKEVTVKGSPLPGVTVTTVERRYGVPFALGSHAERFEMRSLGSTPGTLLQGGDTVPVVAGAWGISPIVTIEDNRVTGGGVRIEREGLGLGVHYRTPETYFGARKGTGSFDPGILHESTLAAAFTTNLSASVFTAAFTTVWTKAEGTELVDLEGFGYRGGRRVTLS